jgi:hypothetical protein
VIKWKECSADHSRPIGLWDVETLTFCLDSRLTDGDEFVSVKRRPLPPGRFLVLISVKRLSRPQGHSAAGTIRSIERHDDLIGNPTRDLPACSVMP